MSELIKRLGKAKGPDRELDWDIKNAMGRNAKGIPGPPRYYTASIDAALTLVPKDADWLVQRCDGSALAAIGERIDIAFEAGATPAIALCIAALKARTPKEQEPEG